MVVPGNWTYYKTKTGQKYFKKNYSFFRLLSTKKFGNITPISVQNFDSNSLKNRELAFTTIFQ
jgi:hypothetical protein